MALAQATTSPPLDPVSGLYDFYLTQGILGVTVIALGFVAWRLWVKLETERREHKVELAAKEALINKLYDDRLNEARVGFDVARANANSLDAFLLAIRTKGSS